MGPPLLRLSRIAKAFGGVRALSGGELELRAGEVTALVGENGAGKSTLVKILTGVHRADAGSIEMDGRAVRIASPAAASKAGISVIHQESVVFESLSVAENIFAADPPRRRALVDWRAMRERSAALLAQLESRIDPGMPLSELSIAERHVVQIARALRSDARIVVMDEPTAALSHHEAEDLLRIVERLKSEGRAILYISHKLEEIFRIADRYVVLRDGATVGAGGMAEASVDSLVRLMAGRETGAPVERPAASAGPEVLRVEGLSRAAEFADVSFSVRAGEILGVYGLVGAGRSEVMRAIFGAAPTDAGRVTIDGRELRARAPEEAIRAGIAYVPEDRQSQGAILTRSIADNIALAGLHRLSRKGFVDAARERAVARGWIERLQVRCSDSRQPVQDLSGGNQQKVVLARWLDTRPRVLILDEPTKGIDVGSKAAVHRLIGDLVRQGLAVVMVSSELPEVLRLSDRILVMRRGRVQGLFERDGASAETILQAAMAA